MLVTHDLGEAAFFGDQVVLMREGPVVQEGTLADLVAAPADPFVTRFVQAPAAAGARVRRPRMKRRRRCVLACSLRGSAPRARRAEPEVRVGSKKFTESVILGEMVAQLAQRTAARAVAPRELGGTRCSGRRCVAASIDVYPEYTGTLRQEILAGATDRTTRAPARGAGRRGAAA